MSENSRRKQAKVLVTRSRKAHGRLPKVHGPLGCKAVLANGRADN